MRADDRQFVVQSVHMLIEAKVGIPGMNRRRVRQLVLMWRDFRREL